MLKTAPAVEPSPELDAVKATTPVAAGQPDERREPGATQTSRPRFVAPGWWAYAAALLLATLLRLPSLNNRILFIDEADYFADAARLRSFDAFVYSFKYYLETKTQLGIIPYLLALNVDHANAVLLLRLFGLLAVLASCWLLVALGQRFLGSAGTGLAAAAIWAIYLDVGPDPSLAAGQGGTYVQAVLLEYFQAPFILGSLYLLLAGLHPVDPARRGNRSGLFWAGLLWAVATLIKPGTVLAGSLYLAALVLFLWREPSIVARSRAMATGVAAFVLGAAIPVVLLFTPYLFDAAAAAELRFNLIEVAWGYSEGLPVYLRALVLLRSMSPAFLLLLLPALPLMLRLRLPAVPLAQSSAARLVALTALVIFVGYLPGQIKPNYLVAIMAPLSLAIAAYLGFALRRLAVRRRPRLALGLAGLLLLVYTGLQLPGVLLFVHSTQTDFYLADDRRRFDLDSMVAYIQNHTSAADSFWVYQSTPELYLLADRHPATGDPSGNWLTEVPTQALYEHTAAELAREQPKLVIYIVKSRYFETHGIALLDLPVVGDAIKRDYSCDNGLISGALICTREAAGSAQQAPAAQ